MNIEAWDGLESWSDLNSFAIGIIGVILADKFTPAEKKLAEIEYTFKQLNEKKAPAVTEAIKENLLIDSTTTWTLEEVMRNEG